MSYQPSNYEEQGGARTVIGGSLDVASGGEIDIESGGALKIAGTAITSTAAELNALDGITATVGELNLNDGIIGSVTFAAAAGGANVSEVTITFKDAAGAAITANNFVFEWWLSDAATGLGLTSTSASGTVQAKSTEGTDLTVLTAKKHTISQTKASAGTYILEITDTAKTQFYVCVKNPVTGVIEASAQLETADYGS